MGKVSAAAEAAATTDMKKRKKKGRPSLIDLQKRNLLKQEEEEEEQQQQQNPPIITSSSSPNLNRRSTRRNPSPELGDDDDDERKEKKVKLVVRLPQSIQQQRQHFDNLPRSSSINSVSGISDSDDGGENPEASPKKRKINAVTDRSGDNMVTDQEEKVTKATDTLHESPLESGPTTPLPDKKLLVFILDRLQKKDTYGVFSEPVDPNELPDYHEIIEHPMDFGTVRRKLNAGLYLNLEQLEANVFLICSNAMQYNSSDTIYFRQARSIQDLAKRDFENLRHEGDDGELRPKVVRRGRPPSKHLKKPLGSTSVDRIDPELSSGATLANGEPTGEDNTNGSNTYNLRRAPPMLYKFQSPDVILTSHRSRNGENYSEWLADWNDEFPASILRADMKYGKKQFTIDESRRDTYKQFHPSAFGHEPSLLSDLGGNAKQLIPVGLHMEHSYARSLARFAANLGSVVWKIASKKLENVLPPGLKFGPGFVGENEASLRPPFFSFEKQRSSTNLACDGNPSRPVTPSTSGVNPVVPSGFQAKDDMVEVDRRLSSPDELALPRSAPFPGIRPGPIHPQNKPVFNPHRNGFNGVSGYNFPSQMGMVRQPAVTGQSGLEEASLPSQIPGMVPKNGSSSTHSALKADTDSAEHKYSESARTLHSGNLTTPDTGSKFHKVTEAGSSGRLSWKAISPHPRQYSIPVQPDLNVRLQMPGSPSSGLRVGSPQQPDLALQL